MSAQQPNGSALTLGIDTSTPRSSVCLASGDRILAVETAEELGSAEALTQLIASVCRRGGAELSSVELIAVCLGPGSFTGLRTGLASAFGLSLGTKRPIRGVSAFAAMLYPRLTKSGAFIVSLPASREELFWTILGAEKTTGGWMIRTLREPGFAARRDFVEESARAASALGIAVEAVDGEAAEATQILSTGAERAALAAQFSWGDGHQFRIGSGAGGLSPIYIKAANAKTLAERAMKC